jgi:hypothetical protein
MKRFYLTAATLVLVVGVLAGITAHAYAKPHCSKACVVRVKHRILRHQRYVHDKERQGMATAVASWYYDAGQTASGLHYQLGFAALIFGSAWGTPVRFCAVRCATGRLDDHGPYVGGRTFDLNPALKAALGCGDICTVQWRVLHEQPKG